MLNTVWIDLCVYVNNFYELNFDNLKMIAKSEQLVKVPIDSFWIFKDDYTCTDIKIDLFLEDKHNSSIEFCHFAMTYGRLEKHYENTTGPKKTV